MPQPLPRHIDRELNPLHVAALASEDVKSPIRLEHFIELIFNLDFGNMLTAGKRPDFLHRDTLKVLFGDEFFGHRPSRWDALQTKFVENCSHAGNQTNNAELEAANPGKTAGGIELAHPASTTPFPVGNLFTSTP